MQACQVDSKALRIYKESYDELKEGNTISLNIDYRLSKFLTIGTHIGLAALIISGVLFDDIFFLILLNFMAAFENPYICYQPTEFSESNLDAERNEYTSPRIVSISFILA